MDISQSRNGDNGVLVVDEYITVPVNGKESAFKTFHFDSDLKFKKALKKDV